MNTTEANTRKGHIRKSKSDKIYDIIVYTIITILLIASPTAGVITFNAASI